MPQICEYPQQVSILTDLHPPSGNRIIASIPHRSTFSLLKSNFMYPQQVRILADLPPPSGNQIIASIPHLPSTIYLLSAQIKSVSILNK